MDPISAMSALASSSSSDEASATTMASAPNLLIQRSGGASFAFKLPEAVAMPEAGSDSLGAAQIYTNGAQAHSAGNMAEQMINNVNDIQNMAGAKVRDVLMGGKTSVNDAMVSVQESTVAFKLVSEVRNKLIDSYQEIMKMQI